MGRAKRCFVTRTSLFHLCTWSDVAQRAYATEYAHLDSVCAQTVSGIGALEWQIGYGNALYTFVRSHMQDFLAGRPLLMRPAPRTWRLSTENARLAVVYHPIDEALLFAGVTAYNATCDLREALGALMHDRESGHMSLKRARDAWDRVVVLAELADKLAGANTRRVETFAFADVGLMRAHKHILDALHDLCTLAMGGYRVTVPDAVLAARIDALRKLSNGTDEVLYVLEQGGVDRAVLPLRTLCTFFVSYTRHHGRFFEACELATPKARIRALRALDNELTELSLNADAWTVDGYECLCKAVRHTLERVEPAEDIRRRFNEQWMQSTTAARQRKMQQRPNRASNATV